MILELSDLDAIQDNALKQFGRASGQKADPSNREEIERETARLESQLEQLYSFTALMARREPDMAKTAELWARLVRISDVFAGRVFPALETAMRSPRKCMTASWNIRSAAEELRAPPQPMIDASEVAALAVLLRPLRQCLRASLARSAGGSPASFSHGWNCSINGKGRTWISMRSGFEIVKRCKEYLRKNLTR